MKLEGARRVMETTNAETANQYLRFGWTLINQHVVEPADDSPAVVTYVLASIRTLEDTRQILTLEDPQAVNEHLALGWKLIDKYLTSADDQHRRHETLHFVLAWQHEDAPPQPSDATVQSPAAQQPGPAVEDIDLLED